MSESKSSTSNALVLIGNSDLTKPVDDKLLQLCRLGKKIISDIEKRAKLQKQKNPESLPGHTLQQGATTRKIRDNVQAVRKMKTLVNSEDKEMPTQTLLDCAKFSVPDLEAATRTHLGCTKDEATATVKVLLGDLIKYGQNSPSLKPV